MFTLAKICVAISVRIVGRYAVHVSVGSSGYVIRVSPTKNANGIYRYTTLLQRVCCRDSTICNSTFKITTTRRLTVGEHHHYLFGLLTGSIKRSLGQIHAVVGLSGTHGVKTVHGCFQLASSCTRDAGKALYYLGIVIFIPPAVVCVIANFIRLISGKFHNTNSVVNIVASSATCYAINKSTNRAFKSIYTGGRIMV